MSLKPYNRQQLVAIRRNADRLELSKAARVRLSWFLFAVEHQGNIQRTCMHFGIARSTFMRWSARFDPADPSSLEERSRRPHHVRMEETPPEVIEWIREYRVKAPKMGKQIIAQLLVQNHGVDISPSTVGRVIERHCFFFGNTKAHERKRKERGAFDVTLHIFTPAKTSEQMILPLS